MLTRVELDSAVVESLKASMDEISQRTGLSIRTWSRPGPGTLPRIAICTTYRPEPALAVLRAIRDGRLKAEPAVMIGNRDAVRGVAQQQHARAAHVEAAEALQPDVALVDIGLPEQRGLNIAWQIRMRNPATAAVILSPYEDDNQIFQAVKIGASAFLAKDIASDQLADMIRRVKQRYPIEVCLSAGLIDDEKAAILAEAGLDRLNHNLNTSERLYPEICSTHTYQDRVATLRAAKREGLNLCTGAIFGMGETDDDVIDVAVLRIDEQKQEVSLGMKQTQDNPWEKVADRYPVGSLVNGKVRNLTNYGAFIEIEEGIDGLLHVSDMSWTRKISHPSEVIEKGQEVECKVLSVDQDRRRIALGLKQMNEDPWAIEIPNRYQQGQLVQGKVTKITNFGVFVGLEDGLEGLLHISELADHKVENPQDVVSVGDQIEVKILRVDSEERKIGLSRKRVEWAEEDEAAAEAAEAKAAGRDGSTDLKGGIDSQSGPLFKNASDDDNKTSSEQQQQAEEAADSTEKEA
ncbi:MAG: S1 RNA-binding domain-containing protein [Planctomycetes bacterium]|nr:S1 RNA-binding domain-containing protein [Planctomycetota bacterium]